MDNVRERAERSWFGYGRWSAPYWFVGMEPGGDASDDDYKAWMDLGGGELIGCRDHAVKTGFLRWHEAERPPTQSTWRRLIQLESSYAGEATNMDAVAQYQRERWAALDGREALIELSSVAAQSLNVAVDRTTHLGIRIATISERLREHQPTFAVFYGLGYREAYERIVGARFDSESHRSMRKDRLYRRAPSGREKLADEFRMDRDGTPTPNGDRSGQIYIT